jgi:hypothetical protein
MARPLDSDELGGKGENRLAELLLDARLKPNSPDRDRVGWDSVVTWPLDETAPADSRPEPLACHIQAKTVWSGNGTISINLSTFEYIAKDARPAFIIVFEVDDPTLEIIKAHIIHVEGPFLFEVLKRLRQARFEGKRPSEVTFEPTTTKWGKLLPSVTGAALKCAMEACIPEGMAAYATMKRRQLARLGYKKGGIQFRTTVTANTQDELIDGFLGLGSLQVADIAQVENRFDITIESPFPPPEKDSAWETLKVAPRPTDRCMIIATRPDGKKLEMKGEFFRVPCTVTGPERIVFECRTSLLRIRVDVNGNEGGGLLFAAMGDFANLRAPAADWATFYRFGAWCIRDALVIEIKTKKPGGPPPLKGGTDPTPDLAEADHHDRMADLAEAAEWVLAAAQAPGTKLTSDELLAAAPDLKTIRTMKLDPDKLSGFTFTSPLPTCATPDSSYELLYVNKVALGDHLIAFAARTLATTAVEIDAISWVTGPMHLELTRKIRNDDKAIAKFLRDARRYTGIDSVFGPNLIELLSE